MGVSIERLCRLPADFPLGRKSAVRLAREAGLFDDPIGPDRAAVEAYLRAHPGLVRDWLRRSEDKRSSPSWWFCEAGGRFVVGRFPADGHEDRAFDDPVTACAEFVVREAGHLRRLDP